jgi:hypothetical protein
MLAAPAEASEPLKFPVRPVDPGLDTLGGGTL